MRFNRFLLPVLRAVTFPALARLPGSIFPSPARCAMMGRGRSAKNPEEFIDQFSMNGVLRYQRLKNVSIADFSHLSHGAFFFQPPHDRLNRGIRGPLLLRQTFLDLPNRGASHLPERIHDLQLKSRESHPFVLHDMASFAGRLLQDSENSTTIVVALSRCVNRRRKLDHIHGIGQCGIENDASGTAAEFQGQGSGNQTSRLTCSNPSAWNSE